MGDPGRWEGRRINGVRLAEHEEGQGMSLTMWVHMWGHLVSEEELGAEAVWACGLSSLERSFWSARPEENASVTKRQ